MKTTINQKLSMMAIALVVAVFGLMFLQHMKLSDVEYDYGSEDRIEIIEEGTKPIDSCVSDNKELYCIVVNFEKDDELYFSFSLSTKQTTLGGVFDEVNEIREDTFEFEEYSIGRSLRRVNGLLAPFDHTAYWSFRSSTHKDCASSDGSEGRCNYGLDSLNIDGDEEFRIVFTYL